MTNLRHAQVQSLFRPITVIFVAFVILTVVGTVMTAWSATTITLTPKRQAITTTLTVTVGPGGTATDRLTGTVASETTRATTTALPSTTGTPVPAHARGTMTIRNTTTKDQPLTSGTRLQSSDGVIVRTQRRVDVLAGGSVEVEVVADPLGEEGNLPPGRFTIVALWAGLQDKIYGQTTETMSGGLAASSGTLSIEALTTASNTAQEEIRTTVGTSTPGTFRTLEPLDVGVEPKADVPSLSYKVTVSSKVTTVTYPYDELMAKASQELTKALADGMAISSIDVPVLSIVDRPTTDSVVLEARITGEAQLANNHRLLQPATYRGLTKSAIEKTATESGLIANATAAISPWWRSRASDQVSRITLRVVAP